MKGIVKGKKNPEKSTIPDKPMTLREAKRYLKRKGITSIDSGNKLTHEFPWEGIDHVVSEPVVGKATLHQPAKVDNLLTQLERVNEVKALQDWLNQPKPILLRIDHSLFVEANAYPLSDPDKKHRTTTTSLILIEHTYKDETSKAKVYTMRYEDDIICWVVNPTSHEWSAFSWTQIQQIEVNGVFHPTRFHSFVEMSFLDMFYKFRIAKSYKSLPKSARTFDMVTLNNHYYVDALDLLDTDMIIETKFDEEKIQFMYIVERPITTTLLDEEVKSDEGT